MTPEKEKHAMSEHGCSNRFCYITGYRKGQATNGTCNCTKGWSTLEFLKLIQRLHSG